VQEQAAEPHGTAVEHRLTTGGGWRQETDTTASFSATEEEAAAGADGGGAQRPRPAEEMEARGRRGRAPRNERRWRGRR